MKVKGRSVDAGFRSVWWSGSSGWFIAVYTLDLRYVHRASLSIILQAIMTILPQCSLVMCWLLVPSWFRVNYVVVEVAGV